MDKEIMTPPTVRPAISEYVSPVDYIRDMLAYRKKNERSFSVLSATKHLRRISPALVTLILKGERKLTLDRSEEFSKLLNLTPQERSYFKAWLEHEENPTTGPITRSTVRASKEVGTHILSDWINIYVKDCFQLLRVQKNPQLIYKQLSLYATPKRIDKSIAFLLREGYLRKTPQGHIVPETSGMTAQSPIPSKKIRQFHKGALDIAKSSLEIFPTTERIANTMTLPLNAESYQEFLLLIQEFGEKIQDFASRHSTDGDRLYQLIVNLSPTGGKFE